ncbi:WD40-repeat-containing domain protein [Coemansia mojavensis]|nr:WD40-repeat-containing domain protein [Coemansia mojavensis]
MDDSVELLDSKAELDQEEMERLFRENRALKNRLDELERENRLLKQRNFDLSMRYGRNAENRRQPFELIFSDSDTGEGAEPNNSSNASDDGDERHGGAGSGVRRREAKQLKCYAELEGHTGAVYSVQYAPAGGLVASASFDKTVRVWDVGEQKALMVLQGHQQSVFDLAWRPDSAALASAGFDRMCIEWDVATQAAGVEMQCAGLVQCVRYSTHNPHVVYSGDSAGFISIHDTRQADPAAQLSNRGVMVNTLFCFRDQTRLVSGDRNGEIKVWDVRMGRFMQLVQAGSQPNQAVSHISVVRNEKSGTEFMAASSYDNVLRVYDRVDDPSVPTPRVIHELRGIRNRNWPIKNAFLDPRVAQEQLLGPYDDDYYELDMRSQSEARGLRSMLFLLTGSAEPYAYLYKLNTHASPARMDDKVSCNHRCRFICLLNTVFDRLNVALASAWRATLIGYMLWLPIPPRLRRALLVPTAPSASGTSRQPDACSRRGRFSLI